MKDANGKNIIIMAGGTGGHVFPALAVALEMRERGWQVSWLGTRKGLESRVASANNIAIDWIAVEGIRGKGLTSKFKAIINLLLACKQAMRILKQRKPNIVLGMGGFVAGPGGLMARLLGIPLVIHEQNRIPGTTNRLLAKLAASKVLEAFPDSFPKSAAAICTGNPLRKAFQNLPEKMPWLPETGRSLRVLVLGGSQGAKVLNENVPDALAGFVNLEIKHQTGEAMQIAVAERYQVLGLRAEISAFIEDMCATYQWADLIICRAGAMTVSEVAANGLPAVFVPFMYAIDDHQTANARYLSDDGAAFLLPQSDLTIESLRKVIEQAMKSLSTMIPVAHCKARLNATKEVADICEAEAA